MGTMSPQQIQETPAKRRQQCYGSAVEVALAGVSLHGEPDAPLGAPRLQELLSQLDADGHDTAALRKELGHLLDAVGVGRMALAQWPPTVVRFPRTG